MLSLNRSFQQSKVGLVNSVASRDFSVGFSKLHKWSETFQRLGNLKNKFLKESLLLLRTSVLQVDYITTNRLKRINSLGGLYSRLYETDKLKDILRTLTKNIRNRSGRFVLGATAFTGFDWEKNEIKGEDAQAYTGDIDDCRLLAKKTLTCTCCGNRLKIDKPVPGIVYCRCKDSPASVYGLSGEEGGWAPFLERGDILVWRKDHPTMKGMYIYKMYGRFDDVSADEYIKVQMDMSEFRMSWDSSTAQCTVLETNSESNQEVYYWEVNWPRFFSNRDYCCVRQRYQDPNSGTTVLVSRSTDHPSCPVKRKCLRVSDYDSVLTVKPFDTPDKLGIEFVLTGFENPGVALPESIITWVAIRGMPEFMQNLRMACIKLRNAEQSTTPLPVQNNRTQSSVSSANQETKSCSSSQESKPFSAVESSKPIFA